MNHKQKAQKIVTILKCTKRIKACCDKNNRVIILENALGRAIVKIWWTEGGYCWGTMSERMTTWIKLVGVKIGRSRKLLAVF